MDPLRRDGLVALVLGLVLAGLVGWAASRVPAEPVVIDFPTMHELPYGC